MKYVKIFFLVFGITLCTLFGAFAQSVELDVVEKDYYKVMLGDSTISQHIKPLKAMASMLEEKALKPSMNYYVSQPNITGIANIEFGSTNDSLVNALLERLEVVERANEFHKIAVEDFYRVDVPNMQRAIHLNDSLHAKKIEVLQNRIDNLNTFIRDSIAFVGVEQVDYSLPIIKGFSHDTTGWIVDPENDSYYYQNTLDNRYIAFDFNRDLEVGKTYTISFDIVADNEAMLSIWWNVDSSLPLVEGWTNGKMSEELTFVTGSYEIEYTVTIAQRDNMGIRAKNQGAFTISNIKIIKQ